MASSGSRSSGTATWAGPSRSSPHSSRTWSWRASSPAATASTPTPPCGRSPSSPPTRTSSTSPSRSAPPPTSRSRRRSSSATPTPSTPTTTTATSPPPRRDGQVAKENGTVAVVSTGWDPHVLLNRTIGQALLPGGQQQTFWGPGLSQGHSDAVRREEGVKNGVQYTNPSPKPHDAARQGEEGLTGKQAHLRRCFIVADEADQERIENEIRTMPDYFVGYEVEVNFIDEATFDAEHTGMPHGGHVITAGDTGGYVQSIGTLELEQPRLHRCLRPGARPTVCVRPARPVPTRCSRSPVPHLRPLEEPSHATCSRVRHGDEQEGADRQHQPDAEDAEAVGTPTVTKSRRTPATATRRRRRGDVEPKSCPPCPQGRRGRGRSGRRAGADEQAEHQAEDPEHLRPLDQVEDAGGGDHRPVR